MVLFALATLPAGADEAEDRHFKFYELRDNLSARVDIVSHRTQELTGDT